MIKLEILHSDDPNREGIYTFEKNQLFIGSNYSADIYLPLPHILKDHLFLEIIESKILLHLGSDVNHLKVNGKRTTTFKYLKRDDTFTIENEKFQLKDFFPTEQKLTSDKLNEASKEIQNDPKVFEIINSLNNLRKDEKQL